MTTIKAHFDGTNIVPDQAIDLPINQPLTLHVELTTEGTDRKEEQLQALDELMKLSGEVEGDVNWSRDSIYSGTLDDPR